MEKINREVNESCKQLFINISKIYNDLSKDINQSYLLGKKEAYEEILNWLHTSNNNNIKYISPYTFHNLLAEKQIKNKIAISGKNEEEEIPLSGLAENIASNSNKFHHENKKKLHRMYQSQEANSDNANVSNMFSSNMNLSLNEIGVNNSTNTNSESLLNESNNTNSIFNTLKRRK